MENTEEKICGNCMLFSHKLNMCFNVENTCSKDFNDKGCDSFALYKKHDEEGDEQ